MIKIVLDTNVFISGLLTPGRAPAQLLELILSGKIKLVISPQIIQEIQRVIQYPGIVKLMKKRQITREELEDAILKIIRVATITSGAVNVQGVCADPDDDMFLAGALEGQADYIISGDHHLIDLKIYQGIKIIPPAAFIELTMELEH
jgi:uncharacterized protein